MGKASRWLRGLLGLKKPDPSSSSSPANQSKKKKKKNKWSFVKSDREKLKPDLHRTASNDNPAEAAVRSKAAGPTAAEFQTQTSSSSNGVSYQQDPEKAAIAVAAAAAAASASTQAAAAVVKLTSTSGRSVGALAANKRGSALNSGGRSGSFGSREDWAAVIIQSHFRAYLAKRAFRALRALVKLQALVRGHMVRKRSADILRRMQSLVRAQERARAGRAQVYDSQYSSIKAAQFQHMGPATPEKFEHLTRAKTTKHDPSLMLKRNGSKSNGRVVMDQDNKIIGWGCTDHKAIEKSLEHRGSSNRSGLTKDDKSDKILEIDTGKPLFKTRRKTLFESSHLSLGSDQNSHSFTASASQDSTAHQTVPSPYSCEVHSLSHLEFHQNVEENSYCTADNSPQYFSASSRGGSSRRGPFTPAKSDGSRSCFGGYSDHPNYMAYTESSRAKMRSLSAPKQRPHFERSSSTSGYAFYAFGDSRSSSIQRFSSALHAHFTCKAYPGSSGRLDRDLRCQ